jgi:hypothetical protein
MMRDLEATVMQEPLSTSAQLALDTVLHKPTRGIPTEWLNVMEHSSIERLAGVASGDYARDPERVYVACQRRIGVCALDQYIPRNPLTMGSAGYEHAGDSPTTGLKKLVLDDIEIDSPEAVVRHLEQVVWPRLREEIRQFDAAAHTRHVVDDERRIQDELGPAILKTGYGFAGFPCLRYGQYGYENYLLAFLVYPEAVEKTFSLEADLHTLRNRAAVDAYRQASLPPCFRLDHDMADSNGTLVDIATLDKIWFPHFARCIRPLVDAGVKLLWHCDGNLMQMVPRLIEVGVKGFQGFQYEDGMDYGKICAMKTQEGDTLSIIAGVSVTATLPLGTPDAVRDQLRWLVRHGPPVGLFLGASSSITPGVPWENLSALVDGLAYYREHGRD